MKKAFLLAVICINVFLAHAQWQMAGFMGCKVRSLAVDGSNIYAGTTESGSGNGGIFLTTNGGNSWNPVSNGLPMNQNETVNSIAISGIHIFAATNDAGIFLSTDNGNSWNAVNNGITDTVITSLAVLGTTIYAGTANQGVFKSTNYGSSWTNTNCPIQFIRTIYVSGTNIYVGTVGFGIMLSTNNGSSWSFINTGLPTGCDVLSITQSGTNLFAGTWGHGVLMSTNNGGNWTPTGTGPHHVWSMVTFGGNIMATAAYDGVYLSTNNGNSWTLENTGASSSWAVWTLAISGSYIYAGDGSTWTLGWVYKRPISDFTTSINNIKDGNDFNIYPNPVSEGNFNLRLNSQSDNKTHQISIHNLWGEAVYENEVYGNSFNIDCASLKDGIYFLRASDGENSYSQKIVIGND
jgi:photosystem II stability/assembly factor-like uncharacterized protein